MTTRAEAYAEAGVRRRSDLELYRRLLRGSRRYWPHMAVILVLSLLAAPLALLAPVPLAIVVDNVIGARPLGPPMSSLLPGWATGSPNSVLLMAAVMLVALAVLGMAQQLSLHLLHAYTGEKLLLAFRSRLFRHVQRLSLGYHDSMGTSDSIYRIQYDAYAVQKVTLDGAIPLVSATLTFGSMLWVTYLVSWQLCLVALAVTPVLLLLTRSYRPRLRRQSHEVKRVESTALSVVQEVLTGIRVVKAFGQEEREAERFVEHSGRGLRARLHLAVTESGFGSAVVMVTAIGLAVTMLVGATLVLDGVITLGALLLVMGYVTQLYGPLKTASKRLAGMQEAFASADRAYALLDEAPDVAESPAAVGIERANGRVEFRRVSFAYDGGRDAVLRDVSFTVRPGQRLGIAGATGAGKTTLVNLLSRFYDPTHGSILLDDRDLREYRLADLRRQFGIVLQDPLLFSTSIAENISYARPGASIEEIAEAARAAGAHDFIASLPDGYDTLVGERGMTLSGGERQRVSLARAFLKDAPILLLDEPTSSVDVKTEAEIMASMDRLMEGRTTLMIAHRLDTLEHCDLVLQVGHGRIVDTHVPASATAGVAPADDRTRETAVAAVGVADGVS